MDVLYYVISGLRNPISFVILSAISLPFLGLFSFCDEVLTFVFLFLFWSLQDSFSFTFPGDTYGTVTSD